MLPAAWINGNTPPQYACATFDSQNFIFYCNNCLNSINDTSNSNSDAFTLSSIVDKIDNNKTLIIDSNNIIITNLIIPMPTLLNNYYNQLNL